MSNIKCANKVIIDFDDDTRFLLMRVINRAVTASIMSGLPVDPKCYKSIEKLKTISELSGVMTIELPNITQFDMDCLEYKGIKGVEKT